MYSMYSRNWKRRWQSGGEGYISIEGTHSPGQSQFSALALRKELPLLKITLLTLLKHREHVALVLARGCNHGGHAKRAGKAAFPKRRLVFLSLELRHNLLKRRCPARLTLGNSRISKTNLNYQFYGVSETRNLEPE